MFLEETSWYRMTLEIPGSERLYKYGRCMGIPWAVTKKDSGGYGLLTRGRIRLPGLPHPELFDIQLDGYRYTVPAGQILILKGNIPTFWMVRRCKKGCRQLAISFMSGLFMKEQLRKEGQ